MKHSETVVKIEKILSENQMGLMKISDVQVLTISEQDLSRNPIEGITNAGEYGVITLQVAIASSK